MTYHDWLTDLARRSLGDFDLTPEIDADLSRRALAARTDPDERNALFVLLAYKVRRFSMRFMRWHLAPWEPADVLQETWLTFVELLESWTPLQSPSCPA